MANKSCRLLLIESDRADAELATNLLLQGLGDCQVCVASDAISYAEYLADGAFAAVISEQDLGWAAGTDILSSFATRHPDTRLILFTRQLPADVYLLQSEIGLAAFAEKTSSGYLGLPGLVSQAIHVRPESDNGALGWSRALARLQEAALTTLRDGRILEANEAAAQVFGRDDPEQLLGLQLADLFAAEQSASAPADLATQLNELTPDQQDCLELAAVPADDVQEVGSRQLLAWLIPGSSKIAVLYHTLGITPAKSNLSAEVSELRENYQQLLYAVSHDLQEPLQLVTRHANLLQESYASQLDAHGVRFMANLVDNALRMQSMLDDLLEFSRVGSGASAAGELDLNKVVDEVLAMYQPTLAEIGGEVKRAGLPSIVADRGQMSRLFQNLIGNAIKFRSEQPLSVTIGARVKGDCWELVIKDNGIGIEPARIDRVFTMFDRLHSQQEYPGNGMGLALCKRIVDMHGGRIWARPRAKPGTGAAFHFTLAKDGPGTPRASSDTQFEEKEAS